MSSMQHLSTTGIQRVCSQGVDSFWSPGRAVAYTFWAELALNSSQRLPTCLLLVVFLPNTNKTHMAQCSPGQSECLVEKIIYKYERHNFPAIIDYRAVLNIHYRIHTGCQFWVLGLSEILMP